MTRRLIALSSVACLGLFVCAARAETFPSRPISIIVTYNPGGANDIIARAVASKMGALIGQPVIVENRPGAGGNVGAAYVAHSAPDGYTILAANIALLAINPWLYGNLQFDAAKDFAPITQAGSVPNMLIVNTSIPVSTAKEFIAYAKAHSGKLFFASMGSGTTGHLSGELFKLSTGVDMTHVAYKGSSPALQDLLGQRVQLMFDNLPTALPLAREGRVKGLAVTSLRRHPLAPDVPTLDEVGLKGFDVSPWFGFVAPAGTPKAIIARLNGAMVGALRDPQTAATLEKTGLMIVADNPDEFAAFIRSEAAKWRDVVAKSGAKPE